MVVVAVGAVPKDDSVLLGVVKSVDQSKDKPKHAKAKK